MADDELARFESMTNVELRTELKRRGYPTSGNKKDLLAKLNAALQKEYEQNISQSISYPVISIAEEEKLRTNNNEAIVLDNSNNIEVNSFVSKNKEEEEKEEEEKNIEKIGGDSDLISSGSEENAKSESIVKEITLSDEQQHLNQSETIHSPTDISNDDIKNQPNEIIDQSSKSADEQPITIEHPEITKETKSSRSQISSLIKIPSRSTVNKINLSFELLKTLITDLTLASESILHDELDNESIIDNDFLPSDSLTIGDLADQKQLTNRTVAIDDSNTRKNLNLNPVRLPSFESKDGKNNIVTDEPVRIKDVTKGVEPASQILYIRGLTRPFSLMQLKELLSRYGTLVIGEFWLDKVKSQCFVTYNTIEEGQNARDALDGCRWPSTNPKTLSVRFGQQDELDFSKTHDLPPDQMSDNKNSEDRVVEERVISPMNGIQSKNQIDEPKESGFLITENEDKEEVVEKQAVKTNEQPAKSLDDYFRKTKAKPSIYWLPLTEEQIIERLLRQERRNVERDEERRKRELNENNQKSSEKRRRNSPFSPKNSKRH